MKKLKNMFIPGTAKDVDGKTTIFELDFAYKYCEIVKIGHRLFIIHLCLIF